MIEYLNCIIIIYKILRKSNRHQLYIYAQQIENLILTNLSLIKENMSEENKIEDFACVEESPKRGPTLSTSTSSFERNDPHDPNLSLLSTKMFEKTSEYLMGELNITEEDYKLLETMNKVTMQKYASYRQIASDVGKQIIELNEKYKSLEPYLSQIDQIEDSVSKLEQAAFKLDAYAKRLEAKYKSLEKRQ